jgi:hypothetical protein
MYRINKGTKMTTKSKKPYVHYKTSCKHGTSDYVKIDKTTDGFLPVHLLQIKPETIIEGVQNLKIANYKRVICFGQNNDGHYGVWSSSVSKYPNEVYSDYDTAIAKFKLLTV